MTVRTKEEMIPIWKARAKRYGIPYGEYREIAESRLSRMRRRRVLELWKQQDKRCIYCQRRIKHPSFSNKRVRNKNKATLEHFIPRDWDVQTNTRGNHAAACAFCNSLRNQMDPVEFVIALLEGDLEPFCGESKRLQRSIKRADRAVRRHTNQIENDPAKYDEKVKRTFNLAWIILNVWPEHVPEIIEREEHRFDRGENELEKRRRKIQAFMNNVERDRIKLLTPLPAVLQSV